MWFLAHCLVSWKNKCQYKLMYFALEEEDVNLQYING